MNKIGVDIEANVTGLDQNLTKAEKRVEAFHATVEKGTPQIEASAKATQGLAGAAEIAGAAIGITTTAAVAAGAAWLGYQAIQIAAAMQMAKTADEMGKMSQRLGIGIETLSELRYSFELNGQSAGQMDSILTRLSSRMQDVANGNGQAALAFKAIGVEVRDSTGSLKSQEQVLGEVADRIAGYRDGAAKTALVIDLLGRGSESLIPLLNRGAEGFRENGEEARKLGAIYTDAASKAAAEFNDNLTRLRFAAEGVKISLGSDMLSTLARLSTELIEGTKAAGGFWNALWMGATLNPLKNNSENLSSVRADLAEMESDLKQYGYLDEQRYNRKKSQLEYLKAMQQAGALKLGEGAYSNEGRGAQTMPDAPVPSKEPKATKGDEFGRLMNRLSGLDANYDKELNALYGAYQKGKLGLDEYRGAVELLIQKQPFATRAAQEEKKALEDMAKVLDRVWRAESHAANAMTSFGTQSDDRVAGIQRQIELLGKTPEQAAQINAFADIDRQFEAARAKIEQVLGAIGDTDGIDRMVGELQRLAEIAKGQAAESLDTLKAKQDELNGSWEYGAGEALRKYLAEVDNVAAKSEKLFGRAFAGMDDALTKFTTSGKLDFKSLTDSIIGDLVRMQWQASVTGPLAAAMKESGGLGGLFGKLFSGGGDAMTESAKGNVFSGAPDLHQYVNTVQTSPKVFGFDRLHAYAKGGIFAEENPEAVMPLARDGQGRLGVRSQGGSGGLVVNITNNGAADGYQARATTRENDGQSVIEIVFEKVRGMMVDDARRNGPVTQAFGNTFGLSRQAF